MSRAQMSMARVSSVSLQALAEAPLTDQPEQHHLNQAVGGVRPAEAGGHGQLIVTPQLHHSVAGPADLEQVAAHPNSPESCAGRHDGPPFDGVWTARA